MADPLKEEVFLVDLFITHSNYVLAGPVLFFSHAALIGKDLLEDRKRPFQFIFFFFLLVILILWKALRNRRQRGLGPTLGFVDLGRHEHVLSHFRLELPQGFGQAIDEALSSCLIACLKRRGQLCLLHPQLVARPDDHVGLSVFLLCKGRGGYQVQIVGFEDLRCRENVGQGALKGNPLSLLRLIVVAVQAEDRDVDRGTISFLESLSNLMDLLVIGLYLKSSMYGGNVLRHEVEHNDGVVPKARESLPKLINGS